MRGATATGLLSLEDARDRVLAAIAGPTEPETAWTIGSRGRVLAAPVHSATALPPWDNSAMDGYAIRSSDVAGATEEGPVRLRVIGEVAAGEAPAVELARGTAARITTGARLPDGADAVVPVELTTPIDAAGEAAGSRGRDATGPLPAGCLVHAPVAAGDSIRRRGSDLGLGDRILEPGIELTPASIAIAAGAGIAQLSVHRRPVVGILATGDEVRAVGDPLGPAGIPDANGPALVALVEAAGGEPLVLGIAKDRLEDVRARLCAGLVELPDAMIVSGGVSVGPFDVVRTAFEEVGTIDLWRVAVQPGKPFAFGTAPRDDRPPVLLFGLPGNPVSTVVTFELFVRPALRRLAGHRRLLRPVDRAVLLDPASKGAGRRAFLRVRAERDDAGSPIRDERGRVRVRLAGGQGSYVLSALAASDGLAVVPEDLGTLEAGAELELWWTDRE